MWIYFGAIAGFASSTFLMLVALFIKGNNFYGGDIMKKLRRIISMAIVLVLFVGILPMHENLLKAEEVPNESADTFKITARIFDGANWEVAKFDKDFSEDTVRYEMNIDKKYKKIQFFISGSNTITKINFQIVDNGSSDVYKVEDFHTEALAIPAGTSYFKFQVEPYSSNYHNDTYNFKINRNSTDASIPHKINLVYDYKGYPYKEIKNAYAGDIIKLKACNRRYGQIFDEWLVESNNFNLKNTGMNINEFIMPNEDIAIRATYKEGVLNDSRLRNIYVYALKDNIWEIFCVPIDNDSANHVYEVNLQKEYDKVYLIMQEDNFKLDDYSEDKVKNYFDVKLNKNPVGMVNLIDYYQTEKLNLPEGENVFDININSKDGSSKSNYILKINKGKVKYKVSFNPGKGSGSMDPEEIVKGSKYNLPECKFEAPENKEFKAWSVNGEAKAVGEEITVDEDTEVIALWKDIMVSVSFNPGDGKGSMKAEEIAKGSTYNLPECKFEAPENKEFKAWSVDGKEKAVGDSITVNDDIEVIATWQVKPIEKVKVTLVANNGTNKTKVENIEKGTEYTLPECSFTGPDGQVFKAWQIGDKEYKPQESIKIAETTIIKAIWQENQNPDKPNPDKPKQTHAINITPSPYGRVIIDPLEAKMGDRVTVHAIANYGYELLSLSVRDASGTLLPIINGQFIMPDSEVSIFPIFREIAPYIEPEIYDKDEREEQKRRHRRDYYHEEENNEDEVKTIDKANEEKQKESKVLITIGSEILDKVDNGVRTLKAMDTKPYIKDGRTMLPLRYVAEALGYRVAWLSETRTAVIMDIGLRVEIPVDSNFIIVNGVKYTSDVKPDMRNNRIMLPIANIARTLGLKDGKDILWDDVNRQVTLIRNFNTK